MHEAISTRLGAIYTRLGAIYTRLGAIYTRLGAFYTRLGAIYTRFALSVLTCIRPQFLQRILLEDWFSGPGTFRGGIHRELYPRVNLPDGSLSASG